MLKIRGQRGSTLYAINELIFAFVFLLCRVILTPLFLIYMFEAENVLYSIKMGVTIILFVQLFWAYRIIEMIFEAIREPYIKKEKKAPAWAEFGHKVMKAVQHDKRTKQALMLVNFVAIFILPHLYYGVVVGNLHFNLVF
jgi:hypothetical protein